MDGGDYIDVEVCYVSRTYMTRHGAGRFDTECSKDEINKDMIDLTNVPNPHQDSLRYGRLNLLDLKNRINADADMMADIRKSIAFTHCNEYRIDENVAKEIFEGFQIYLSDGMTHKSVCIV